MVATSFVTDYFSLAKQGKNSVQLWHNFLFVAG
jgi:hypothetical protein